MIEIFERDKRKSGPVRALRTLKVPLRGLKGSLSGPIVLENLNNDIRVEVLVVAVLRIFSIFILSLKVFLCANLRGGEFVRNFYFVTRAADWCLEDC